MNFESLAVGHQNAREVEFLPTYPKRYLTLWIDDILIL
jgi:hypothetical protein